jgi:hypothetical protein
MAKYKHPQEVLDKCTNFKDIKWFKPEEFKYPHLIDIELLTLLDSIRAYYGEPIYITDDYRPANINYGSKTSLHKYGRAVDIRSKHLSATDLYKLIDNIMFITFVLKIVIELEIDNSKDNKHIHIGLLADNKPSKLIIKC